MDHTMRHEARLCLERAKKLIEQGDEFSVRYACIELRFAIEYLVYQLLYVYKDELCDDDLQKWTPKQVISAMLAIDPYADKSCTIACGIEEFPGVPPKEMRTLGEDRRLNIKLANTIHNALGNFLHVPTLFQISNRQIPTDKKILNKAIEVAKIVEHALETKIYNVDFGSFYMFECGCGKKIKRRVEGFRQEDGIKCHSCGAIYDIESECVGKSCGEVIFNIRKIEYECLACGSINYVEAHLVNMGSIIVCTCGAKHKIVSALQLIEPEPDSRHQKTNG